MLPVFILLNKDSMNEDKQYVLEDEVVAVECCTLNCAKCAKQTGALSTSSYVSVSECDCNRMSVRIRMSWVITLNL